MARELALIQTATGGVGRVNASGAPRTRGHTTPEKVLRPATLSRCSVSAHREEIFGWMKTVGGFRRTRFIGLELTQLAGYLVATAYNLVRIARLVVRPTAA